MEKLPDLNTGLKYIRDIKNLCKELSKTYQDNDILQKLTNEEILLIDKVDLLYKSIWHVIPKDGQFNNFSFEILLVDHCNLNCYGCNHYAPLAKPHFYDFEQLKKDLTRISELFDKKAEIILMGGEPLIHPQINEIIELCNKLFYKTQIYTNGLVLIKEVNENKLNILNFIKKYNIDLQLTQYNQNYDNLYKTLKLMNIKYILNEQVAKENQSEPSTFKMCSININGDSDNSIKYLTCGNSNFTNTFVNGKFYACGFKATVHHFIDYFHYNNIMPLSNNDGISIYDVTSKEEIINFLTHGTDGCKYCAFDVPGESGRLIECGPSKKELSEWLDPKELDKNKNRSEYDFIKRVLYD